ncbi:MFS transporter [Streptomyces tubercidicus]|uniref:MFS transporter n=1 Tax=Streptomyces tubercidicus TaxID=47759 RepID=A0A640V4D9_9ACTN|nr:MFS transporter [Streptomyces tubercidicus]GFE42240.1 MFS transporter [Streptomyces tubercidicus]
MGSWPGHGEPPLVLDASGSVAHLVSCRYAWGVALTVVALAMTDYIDRQIVVSTFPYLKRAWGLSDTALGALVTTVSVTIAVFALPAARLADRWGRVRTIAAMGSAWSLAALACAVSGNYAQLFAARSLLGVGEAGYGPAGAALLSGYFPQRLRATVLSVFQAAGPLGSVLGVVLGGVMAGQFGWRVTLGAFGVPGLLLALVFLKVRDYRTATVSCAGGAGTAGSGAASGTDSDAASDAASDAGEGLTGHRASSGRPDLAATVRGLFRSRTAVWCYLSGALNLVVLSTLYTWLPSYLGRAYGLSSAQAGMKAALFILAGFLGVIVFGHLADRCAAVRPRHRLMVPAVLAAGAWGLLFTAFGVLGPGGGQYALIVVAGLPMAAALGTAPAAVIDVVHPSVRATAVGMAALVQNLFGLAVGPLLTGLLSDAFGLRTALAVMPLFCLAAAAAFRLGSRSYEKDLAAVSGGGPEPIPPGTHERELST